LKSSGIVTLTTDFGTVDGYVGSVKGAILSINPKAHLVDLTNAIPSYDIVVGAFHLGCAFSFYPRGTVHLGVVDPGVGSERHPLLVVTKNYFLVGPDNGLFTLVVQKDPAVAVYELTEKKYWRSEMSSTFHGRDLFGPVAAYLTRGVVPSSFGKKKKTLKLLDDFKGDFKIQKQGQGYFGKILFFDKFGNAFSNIQKSQVRERTFSHVEWNQRKIFFYHTYSEIPRGEPGAIFGSAGFLEIALREDSFKVQYGASKESTVFLKTC